MDIGNKLSKLGLISGNKTCEVFKEIYPDIMTLPYESPAQFFDILWNRYKPDQPSTNGAVFEGLISTLFYREKLTPFFIQAKVAFVPNVDFDFILYSKEIGPVIISAKVSLRERYKQADLEGMMLRQVYRRSESYLLTLNESEARIVNRKIDDGDVLGLNKVVLVSQPDMNGLIDSLKNLTLFKPDKIDLISSGRLIEKEKSSI